MKEPLKRTSIWGALFVILVLMATGCRSPSQAQEPTATPSPPTITPAVARLDVRKIVVEHHRQGGPSRDLTQDERVDVHENDQIKVINKGRAILDFQDSYEVELFRGAEVNLERIRVDPDGFVFTILRHTGDHIRVEQNQSTNGRLMVVTDHATITLAEPETEAVVCHAAPVTCIAAVKGRVEVEAQGEVTTLEEDESTFVLKDQPPKPAICSDRAELRRWLDKKLGTGEVEDLVDLVQRWAQEPCPESATPTPTVTPPASSLECNVIARALNVRVAPGAFHKRPIDALRYGERFEAVARNADGTWVQVARPQTGWVSANTHYVSCAGSITDLPVSD